MPIKPENKKLYPDNWKSEIVPGILERSKNCCEFCGAKNHEPHPITKSKVVLTIAHIDDDPANCDPSNLRALCQRDHNRYDVIHRAETRKATLELKKQKQEVIQLIPIEKLTLDESLQIRFSLNEKTVHEYAENMKEGDYFPPVDVFFDGTIYWLTNGFHRYAASVKVLKKEIKAKIHQGTKRDALLFAIKADNEFGLMRSKSERRYAIELMLRDEEWRLWSYESIAKAVRVSPRTVSSVAKALSPQVAEIVTTRKCIRGGTEYVVKTKAIGRNSSNSISPENEPITGHSISTLNLTDKNSTPLSLFTIDELLREIECRGFRVQIEPKE